MYPATTKLRRSFSEKTNYVLRVSLGDGGVWPRAVAREACPVFGQIVASRLTSMSSFRVKVYDFAQHTRAAMLSVAADGSFTGPEVPVGLYTITVLTIRDEQIVEQMVQIRPGITPITLRLPRHCGSQPPSGAVSLTHLSHHVPSRALKAFERAQQEARSGDRAASFAHLQDALAADPDFFEARVNLGAAYMARNEPKQASDQFAYAVRLDSFLGAGLDQFGIRAVAHWRGRLCGRVGTACAAI